MVLWGLVVSLLATPAGNAAPTEPAADGTALKPGESARRASAASIHELAGELQRRGDVVPAQYSREISSAREILFDIQDDADSLYRIKGLKLVKQSSHSSIAQITRSDDAGRFTRSLESIAPDFTEKPEPTIDLSGVDRKDLVDEFVDRLEADDLVNKDYYGTDDREELSELVRKPERANALRNAVSTVALMVHDDLKRTDSGWKVRTKTLQSARGVCPNEAFASQPVAAFCSGVLVRSDIVATAHHCLTESKLEADEIAFVFGFATDDDGKARVEFADDDVYVGRELFAKDADRDQDWALIRLARPVAGRPAATLRTSGKADRHDDVYVIGHPLGLPAKYAGNAWIRRDTNPAIFVANLDTYGGNSGSPVYGPSNEVEGLLLRGERDFSIRTSAGCYRSQSCPTTGCKGEVVTRIANLLPHLP